MPRPTSFADVEIETGEKSAVLAEAEPDIPFHIAVLGDFSGRENRGVLDAKPRAARR
jgi:predicted component of type VI protein secretion system